MRANQSIPLEQTQPQELGPCSTTLAQNFVVCTELVQTVETANPSLIPPSANSPGNCQQLFPKQAGSFFPLVSFC